MALTRDQILNAPDRPATVVDVPEWGGELWLAALSAADALTWSAASEKNDVPEMAMLLAKCAVKGEHDMDRLFSDEDAKLLMQKSATVIGRLFKEAADRNGIGKKAQEELRGNSEGGPDGVSLTD